MPSPISPVLFGVVFTTVVFSAAGIKCPIGTFRKNKTCQKCPPGTYQEQPDKTRCKKCSANTYTPFSGVISSHLCLDCPEDSVSPPGSASCKKCRNGGLRYCGKCIFCPPGTYVDDCNCMECGPDSFSNTTSAHKCTKCPDGMRSTKDRKGCEDPKCPPGTEWAYSSCSKCGYDDLRPTSTFRNTSMLTCEFCPQRTTLESFVGLRDRCIKCPPGKFITNYVVSVFPSVRFCQTCPKGTTTKGHGKLICRKEGALCPSDFFEDEDGDCETCLWNQRYVPSEKKCVDCTAGEFSEGGLVTKCRRCGGGRVLDGQKCGGPGGKSFLNGKCRDCPAGTYRHAGAGDEICMKCRNHEFSEMGSTRCTECPKGTSSRLSKGGKCEKVKCPDGFILPPKAASYFGDDICVSGVTGCPKGLIGLGWRKNGYGFLCANKKGNVKILCDYGYFFDNVDSCFHCDTNFRVAKKSNGRLGCERCPRGQLRDEENIKKCKPCKEGLTFVNHFNECKLVCPKNTFISDGKCHTCQKGFGKLEDPKDGSICAKCRAGTFSSGSECVDCPANMTSSAGATKCTPCPPGTMSSKGHEYGVWKLRVDATCTPI